MRNYHLFLADASQRNIRAYGYTVAEGVLNFLNQADETILSYAAGTWVYVEVERLDDKGYPETDLPEPK